MVEAIVATLMVHRVMAVEGVARRWRIVIDGQEAAELGPDETTELAIYAGQHVLEVRPGRPAVSASLSFSVGANEVAEFVCRPLGGLRLRPGVVIEPRASSTVIFGNPPEPRPPHSDA